MSGELMGWTLDVFGTQPGVSVSVLDGSASEAGDLAEVAIERSGDLSKPLTVELNWTNAQEATLSDGSPLPSSVVLAAGKASVSLSLAAIADGLEEPTEFVSVSS
ncbi:MAG: hypothetical protein HC795_07095 [Coleofasciculaceae cyanobacterium RL_1_1]|nr:hypothetical protein [Coleofasciculaceae cyanobacterium RL_1_1]